MGKSSINIHVSSASCARLLTEGTLHSALDWKLSAPFLQPSGAQRISLMSNCGAFPGFPAHFCHFDPFWHSPNVWNISMNQGFFSEAHPKRVPATREAMQPHVRSKFIHHETRQ